MKKPPPNLVSLWYGRAAASGFRDIESPMRAKKTGDSLWHQRPAAEDEVRYWAQADAYLRDADFRDETDLACWRVHVEQQAGEWAIARAVFGSDSGGRRRKVRRILTRLRAEMEGKGRKGPGRPRDPEGLRSEGMRVNALLTPRAALALDYLQA